MSFLWITIPVSLLVTGTLLALVVRAVLRGDFDDWEGPAARHLLDDDASPEADGDGDGPPALSRRAEAERVPSRRRAASRLR